MNKEEILQNSIIISIKPIHLKRIESGIKNYEFRNYIPKRKVKYLIVHESGTGIKYIIEIDNIIEYPNNIKEDGYGNDKFNNGLMTKYAYHIKHVYKINKILDLKYLREKYNFRPPQAFMYTDNYKELIEEILNIKKDKIR